jgi:hypothetical protein
MAYQPPVSSTFLSEQTNNHLAVTFLSEQKSAQPNELSLGTKQISTVKRTGCKLASPI